MSALNTQASVIAVILGGTAIPLPSNPYLDGFTANVSETIFTVPVTGFYYVSYQINTTIALLLSSGVFINGSANLNTVRSPGIAINNYSADVIIPLNAGDTLQLTLFGIIGAAVLQGGIGASLNVIRVV